MSLLNFPTYLLERSPTDFHWGGGQSFDWQLATIAGMEVAKLVPWNAKLDHVGLYRGVSGV